jgi:hypothetical protein
MNRRVSLCLLPLLAAAIFALGPNSSADDRKVDAHQLHHGPFIDCAKACDDCARSCEACSTHCAHLITEGKKDHAHTLHTCQDCATACSAASAITARHGPFFDLICTACAEACKRCGEACAKHSDDEMMKACAEECTKCEKACREMLKHAGHEERESK